jgi:hypothetical protein
MLELFERADAVQYKWLQAGASRIKSDGWDMALKVIISLVTPRLLSTFRMPAKLCVPGTYWLA